MKIKKTTVSDADESIIEVEGGCYKINASTIVYESCSGYKEIYTYDKDGKLISFKNSHEESK